MAQAPRSNVPGSMFPLRFIPALIFNFWRGFREAKIKGEEIYIFGDNKKLSSKLKPINLQQVVGRVILKY